ncbi:sodium/solute symporter [Fulvivirgaceae bacterium BMA12]|uniref:Sodium/solute symporter n=1 Tax=Agaribacillus aureus TaxID=3051825 RepID=A0ABT8LH20_9BACT|nr:sodium/solute symporter [Fulvivirgaceae bacterium BMA12]
MELHWLDITLLVAYMMALLGMGYYFSRKNTSTEEYFVGGRSFPGWVIGLSMVGTSISSVTFLAYPADGFKTAWLRFLPNFMLPVALVFAAYFFLPFFRRTKITTAYEYLEQRFGPSIRVYGAITFIITQLIRISIILYLLSLLIHEITGLDTIYSILIGGVFVGIYTIIGGIDAVIWTDVIQTVMLVAGGIICIGIIINALPGGINQLLDIAISNNKFAFAEVTQGEVQPVSWAFTLSDKTGLMMLILGLSVWLQEYGTNQNVIQRYAAAKNIKEARKAMYVAMINVPIWAFYMFLGTALYAFFQVFPTIDATEMLDGTQKPEQILPYFIINYLPHGITGLVIAAAIAAAMSSLDSSINAVSTVGIHDIYRRHLVKDEVDKHYLKMAWAIATVTAIFMITGAILLAKADTKTIQDAATILSSLSAAGIFGLYMFGFFTRYKNALVVWLAIGITIVFSLWTVLDSAGMLPKALGVPFDLYYTAFLSHVLLFACAIAAALFFTGKNKQDKDLTNLTVWTQDDKPIEN